jgi:hemerythrin superfamily protein
MKTGTQTDAGRAKSQAAPDALTMLRADHEEVLDMFEQFEAMKSDGPKKKALVEKICNELTIHTTIEEEILYPAAREAIGDDDLMDEADVEHQGAKDLIAKILAQNPGDDHYDAKVTVLGENIKHHVKEEHAEMFPKIKKSDLDTKALGAEMLARKNELKRS